MLWGKSVEPETGRTPFAPFLISICLIAMSRDFFEMVPPNPALSVCVLTGFLRGNCEAREALPESDASVTCPFASTCPLPGGSVSLPLLTIGDECLLCKFPPFGISIPPLTEAGAPGLDLPADSGLSGSEVRKFEGVSSEKSGGTIG